MKRASRVTEGAPAVPVTSLPIEKIPPLLTAPWITTLTIVQELVWGVLNKLSLESHYFISPACSLSMMPVSLITQPACT